MCVVCCPPALTITYRSLQLSTVKKYISHKQTRHINIKAIKQNLRKQNKLESRNVITA